MGGSLCFRHPLQYGKQQLTGPRRFGFVKSAVLKISSRVAGRARGQLHLHLPAVGVQSHSQRYFKQANDEDGNWSLQFENLRIKLHATSVASLVHPNTCGHTHVYCVCVTVCGVHYQRGSAVWPLGATDDSGGTLS